MPEGVVIGGWGFINAAYGLTLVVLVLYIWGLFARQRRLDRKGQDE